MLFMQEIRKDTLILRRESGAMTNMTGISQVGGGPCIDVL